MRRSLGGSTPRSNYWRSLLGHRGARNSKAAAADAFGLASIASSTPSATRDASSMLLRFGTGVTRTADLVSPVAHAPSLERMGVPTAKVFDAGRFTSDQGRFLEYHRDEVFLSARVRSAG